jgi:hypothetical protein
MVFAEGPGNLPDTYFGALRGEICSSTYLLALVAIGSEVSSNEDWKKRISRFT